MKIAKNNKKQDKKMPKNKINYKQNEQSKQNKTRSSYLYKMKNLIDS